MHTRAPRPASHARSGLSLPSGSDSLHPCSGEETNTGHCHVRNQLLPLAEAPAPAKSKVPKEGPTSIPPQDNQPIVVLFSAVSPRTLPEHCVLLSGMPQSCRDTSRAGRRQQARQEHSHISDGTAPIHCPLPPPSYLLPFQLQDAETPQKLIQATFRGQRGAGG